MKRQKIEDYAREKPISASEALKRTNAGEARKSEGINYKLTIKRVYKIIENAADKGAKELEFHAPSFVLDGCLGDSILLAKQIKSRLQALGYKVKRDEHKLKISWEK